ncbi:MAG: hypothetical protein JWP12_96 [Bacteroidetes bacterium]|nr:hypothetical protein [Bacteroidota bacterium]
MKAQTVLLISMAVYFCLIVFLDLKFQLLRDTSNASKKPYSFSKVQMAWWMGFIMSAFAAVIFDKNNAAAFVPTFSNGALIVLGISTGTSVAARLIDSSDQSGQLPRIQDQEKENIFLDILSDNNGVSISRLQTVLFNLIFSVWFFIKLWKNLDCFDAAISKLGVNSCSTITDGIKTLIDGIIPDFDSNTLVLLGISSGTYAAFKTTENKSTPPPAAPPVNPPAPAVG